MNISRSIIFTLLKGVLSGLLFFSTAGYAGTVVACKQFVEKQEHRCVIQVEDEEDILEGDQAILYSPRDFYWVATGRVLLVKGNYVVAAFREADPRIHSGLQVVLEPGGSESVLSWDLAFSKPDLPGGGVYQKVQAIP